MKTWFEMKAAASGEKKTDILIFDEIGLWGVTAKDFAVALKAIPEDHAITVRINSPGGSVFDGYAIFNALKSRAANVTTRIEGLAASMASIIALAGSKVTAAANSIVMIHNPLGGVMGEAEEMRKMADVLDKLTSQLAGIYAAKTGLSEADVRAAMDAETWFTAAEAKEWGLVDEVDEALALAASFDVSRFSNPKAELDAVNAKLAESAAAVAAVSAERDTLKQYTETLAAELATVHAELDKRDAELARAEAGQQAERAIDAAITAGKIQPEARDDFVLRHIADAIGTAHILAAIPERTGNAPVKAEAKHQGGSDAAILAEYRALTGDAKTNFYTKHKDAIWRAVSAS